MPSYGIGNAAKVKVLFRDVDSGQTVDPTTVAVTVKTPSNISTSYTYGIDLEVQKQTTGSYFFIVDLNEVGEWKYRWLGTGDNQAAAESSFTVVASSF